MRLRSIRIENFKSIQNLEVFLDDRLSVLTGTNNCGKTTVLEAIALWQECFEKLLHKAQRAPSSHHYQQGDYVFGSTDNRYFDYNDIVSVRSPNFEDLFYNKDTRRTIRLSARIAVSVEVEMTIPFALTNSASARYSIQLENDAQFDYDTFNRRFRHLPDAVSVLYSSPIAAIDATERFLTDPDIKDHLKRQLSSRILRNRIYKLYHNAAAFSRFQHDLSFVLYGDAMAARLRLISRSDINADVRVVINYQVGDGDVEKDIALLGSGSLQVIGILLNLYSNVETPVELSLILLDEPDSHIHRDIQNRLIDMLMRSADNTQIVLTTHNEAFIRHTPLRNLFHLDGRGEGTVRCVHETHLEKPGRESGEPNQTKTMPPNFHGLYPNPATPIIRSLASDTTGLDFISAIEADKIIFVEGTDDARLLFRLIDSDIANRNGKVVFWVLGGINEILGKVNAYQTFFSEIHNGQSLWEKSLLVFDRDRLTDDDLLHLQQGLAEEKRLRNYTHTDAYTQESVLLTDLTLLSKLLQRQYALTTVSEEELTRALQKAMEDETPDIRRWPAACDTPNNAVQQYKGLYLDKLNALFPKKTKDISDIDLEHKLQDYAATAPLAKLARKDNVINIIAAALSTFGLPIDRTDDTLFYTLTCTALDSHLLYPDWLRLSAFLAGRE